MVYNCTTKSDQGRIPKQQELEEFGHFLNLPFKYSDLKDNIQYNNWANYLHELGHWAICHPIYTNQLINEKCKFYDVPYGWGGLDETCVQAWCHLVLKTKDWINPIYDSTINIVEKERWYEKNFEFYDEAFITLFRWDINPLLSKYRPSEPLLIPERKVVLDKPHYIMTNNSWLRFHRNPQKRN
jgi:hypothetical protein